MATFTVERAKSGRSTCKASGTKIAKGEWRIGRMSVKDEITYVKWYRASCFTSLPRGKSLDEFLEELRATTGDEMKDGDWDEVQKLVRDANDQKRKNSAAARASPTKKAKMEPITSPGGQAAPTDIVDKYSALSGAKLKVYLRWNKQVLSGTKHELVKRCVLGEWLGALPICPVCEGGGPSESGRYKSTTLRMNENSVFCAGYHDGISRVVCNFKAPFDDLKRQNWIKSEEEFGTAKNEEDLKKAKAATSASSHLSPDSVTASVGSKDAARAILEAARSAEIAVPENEMEGLLKCGQLWLEFMDIPDANVKIMDELLKEWGSLKKKKAQKEAAAASCKCQANAALVECFVEMSQLMKKAGAAGFKVAAVSKAAQALAELSYEVTDGKMLTRKKTKVAGIGKSTAERIDEYLSTGKIERLEALRAEHG